MYKVLIHETKKPLNVFIKKNVSFVEQHYSDTRCTRAKTSQLNTYFWQLNFNLSDWKTKSTFINTYDGIPVSYTHLF